MSDDGQSPPRTVEGRPDGRHVRGLKSRRSITRHAVDVASLEGLNGLSFGRLASDLGLSKSGVQALFGTKENLQLAVIKAASEQFMEAVVDPAMAEPAGVARVRALIENWITYATEPLFVGGCFWTANMPDFDSRPGLVRDALFGEHFGWRDLLSGELRTAVDAGEIADVDVDLVSFEITAVLSATNTALRYGEAGAVDTARRAIEGFFQAPG